MFVTPHISNLAEEITKFKAGGEVITWNTSQLPPRPNSSDYFKPLFVVKVWLKDWESGLKTYLLDGYPEKPNKARVDVSSGWYWMVQYNKETLPLV
jgi:hypothetical protein